ncbi:heterokaryon incompatibility protein [Paraphaeosphaeria sporulosa]
MVNLVSLHDSYDPFKLTFTMEFCTKCQTIISKLFIKSRYHRLELQSHDQPSRQLVQHLQLGRDYREVYSIDEGCKLCTFIKRGLPDEAVARRVSESWRHSRAVSLRATGGNALCHASDDGGLQIFEIKVSIWTVELIPSAEFYFDFSLTAAKGSSAATAGDVFGTNPLLQIPVSDILAKLTGWFNECASYHDKCRRHTDTGITDATKPELPTRVLDIRSSQDDAVIHLIAPHGLRANYAALSHCWGPPAKQPLRTTKVTLDQHLAGIQVSHLPKTFQDAVSIARAVNLQYLWIDSLCIIQDDPEDWNKEAPCMGQLYSHAKLVIAASGANDSSEGCFLPRLAPEPSIDIPYMKEDSNRHGHVQLNMRRSMVTSQDGTPVMPIYEPLGGRGWVLQEWALARRLVHFTTRGMMWSCRALDNWAMCEDGHVVAGTTARDWDDVIEAYSLRKLTYLSDKLAAVEGIARKMQHRRQGQYISGLWTGEMPQQLFWVARMTTRPRELQRFPSWSWASTQGPCVMLVPKRIRWDKITIRSTVEAKDSSALMIQCQAGKHAIGKDSLTLREATQLPPFVEFVGANTIPNLWILLIGGLAHRLLDPDTQKTVGLAVLDDNEDSKEDDTLCTSLLLMEEISDTYTQGRLPIFLALLVREAGAPVHAYQRIGVAFIVDEKVFETQNEKKFTLI